MACPVCNQPNPVIPSRGMCAVCVREEIDGSLAVRKHMAEGARRWANMVEAEKAKAENAAASGQIIKVDNAKAEAKRATRVGLLTSEQQQANLQALRRGEYVPKAGNDQDQMAKGVARLKREAQDELVAKLTARASTPGLIIYQGGQEPIEPSPQAAPSHPQTRAETTERDRNRPHLRRRDSR